MNPPVPTEFYYTTLATPAGAFALAVDASGALVAAAFGGLDQLKARTPGSDFRWVESMERTAEVRQDVEAYFADGRHLFVSPRTAAGSAFQQKVWAALVTIPAGQTRTYGQLAKSLKSSARAIGRANATNPLCLFVPCHRLIGSDRRLTGSAFGEELKAKLLEHEGVRLDRVIKVARS